VSGSVTASELNGTLAGTWRITATRPGYPPVDITQFRGQPTQVGGFSFSDPFGPKSMTLTFPAITFMDARGHGDLYWCVHDTSIDVLWDGDLPTFYPFPEFRWAGYMVGPDFDQIGTSYDCIGALMQHDNELAKPLYPTNPLPYEVAIARALDPSNRPWVRTAPLVVQWPSWWDKTYTPVPSAPSYLVPSGVDQGDRWTGLLTRSTGSFDPVLTSYVQTLLGAMYTARGRWSIDLLTGRVPTLLHRDITYRPTQATVVVDPIDPGVQPALAEDWSQTGNAFYGQGSAIDGVGYTGALYGADGQILGYQPLATSRQTYPVGDPTGWFDPTVMRREVQLQLTQGLNEAEAVTVGQSHLQMFSDPGVTGTITLSSDVRMVDGEVLSRFLVRAGMDVLLLRYGGSPTGVMCHVVSSECDLKAGTNALTIDSRFRDFQTVAEVMKRGRDALSVVRMLVGGQYQPPVPDQILPWNYADGSGFIPSGGGYSAVPLFQDMPEATAFPWTSWTTAHPPSKAAWRSSYIHIGPASSTNANANWATLPATTGTRKAYPIKMSQAGTIGAFYLAAYDKNGNVLQVPFSVSFYYVNGVSDLSMPLISATDVSSLPSGKNYKAGQNYPFTPEAWETYNPDGTMVDTRTASAAVTDSGLVRVYGTYYDPAGYYPSSAAEGGSPTGLLVDTTSWTFDVTSTDAQQFDPYSKVHDQANPLLGFVYAMIYCDGQGAQDVYFLGRLYVQPPGTNV
jgi:hypothetical protein